MHYRLTEREKLDKQVDLHLPSELSEGMYQLVLSGKDWDAFIKVIILRPNGH